MGESGEYGFIEDVPKTSVEKVQYKKSANDPNTEVLVYLFLEIKQHIHI